MSAARAKPVARPAPAPTAPPPAWGVVLVALVASLLVGLGVSFRLDDPDLWQHLAVGRAIWQGHAIPATNVWTWPTYGQPYMVPSWLFRVLLWPVWAAGGDAGMLAWRWVTTLGTFAILWLAARRMGARGLVPLVAFVWCAMVERQRSQVRPETLCGLLLAAEIALLEARRAGARVSLAWLPGIAWVWINLHISYVVFFEIGLAYLADDFARRRPAARPLAVALAAGLALAFVNPYGWHGVWQPFDFLLHERNEAIFRSIDELKPIPWAYNLRNGLPLLIVALPLLAIRFGRRRGFDVAELVLLVLFLPQALMARRFVGTFAFVAAPFLARDLAEWFADAGWPVWTRAVPARVTLALAGCLLVALPELSRQDSRPTVGFLDDSHPRYACDWIEAHGVRGRAFHPFAPGGYLLWRFWPQRDRLPFMDVHQTGTPRDRDLVAYSHSDPRIWRALDDAHRFDWAILPRFQRPGERLLEYVAADSAFALVFADDAWTLWLRRDGAMAPLAARYRYDVVPASFGRMAELGARAQADTAVRRRARLECERMLAESPRTSHARSLLANFDLMDGAWSDAVVQLEAARRIDPAVPMLAERLALARDSLAASRR